MVLDMIMDNQRETADNIGEEDTNTQLIIKRNIEKVFVESGPLIIETRDVSGTIMIWGSATHGIWGTDKWGAESSLPSYSVQRVVNPNNIWREHFRDAQFKDTTNTTATWDVTNFRIDFNNKDVAQTYSIFKNSQTITSGKVSTTITGSVDLYLSIDGSLTWVQVANNVESELLPNTTRVKIDTANFNGGRTDVVLSSAGTVSGSVYTKYDNTSSVGITVINPYIIGGIVYDTDGSTPLQNVYILATNETTGAKTVTTSATGSNGKFLLDCRNFGTYSNGDYIKLEIIGGSGTGGTDLRFKAVARVSSSKISDPLKIFYTT